MELSLMAYGKLDIDFDGAEAALISKAAMESDLTITKIKQQLTDGIEFDDMFHGLDVYVRDRIKNAADIACINVESFVPLLCSSPVEMVRPILAKSAIRTVFQEKLQFDTLSNQSSIVTDLVDLPNGGRNAMYIGARKSVDFVGHAISNGHDYRILIAAKYTKSDGGAQDNQRNDLIDFANHAPLIGDKTNNDVVVLLADGPYYRKSRHCLDDMDFFSYIESRYSDRKVVATSTEDFDVKLGSFLDKIV